jgi:hypothetical protein
VWHWLSWPHTAPLPHDGGAVLVGGQHGWPSAPQAWQLPGPPVGDPPMQTRPPVQVGPPGLEQQAWPWPPQAWQVVPLHCAPALHDGGELELPGQQAWPSSPQGPQLG